MPGAQLVQDDDATEPVLARYKPAAQLVQPPDPGWDWKLPVAQFAQDVAPVDEAKLPATHVTQPGAPEAAWLKPAAHSAHEAAPAPDEYAPAEQALHGAAAPDAVRYMPTAQLVHTVALAMEYAPAGQVRHAVDVAAAGVAEADPAAHAVQLGDPVPCW